MVGIKLTLLSNIPQILVGTQHIPVCNHITTCIQFIFLIPDKNEVPFMCLPEIR